MNLELGSVDHKKYGAQRGYSADRYSAGSNEAYSNTEVSDMAVADTLALVVLWIWMTLITLFWSDQLTSSINTILIDWGNMVPGKLKATKRMVIITWLRKKRKRKMLKLQSEKFGSINKRVLYQR